jgi:hypothetical protein
MNDRRLTMTAIRWGAGLVGLVALVGGWSGSPGAANPTKAQVCEALKNTAAGAKAACLARAQALAVQGRTGNFAICETEFTLAFQRAERNAGPGVCPTEGDTGAIEAMVDTCMGNIASALAGNPPPGCTQFPATGQTTCWNGAGTLIPCAGTGQDGDIRAGAVLSYTDNGDGTITDNNTGRMWAKKSDDGSIHDKDTTYTWENAFAVHIAGLNAAGFAGHTDWRLPNVRELQSIVNYETFPAVPPAFNTGCVPGCTVLPCSCTAATLHWSSSTFAGFAASAWFVNVFDGAVLADNKPRALRVRAVRGGL